MLGGGYSVYYVRQKSRTEEAKRRNSSFHLLAGLSRAANTGETGQVVAESAAEETR